MNRTISILLALGILLSSVMCSISVGGSPSNDSPPASNNSPSSSNEPGNIITQVAQTVEAQLQKGTSVPLKVPPSTAPGAPPAAAGAPTGAPGSLQGFDLNNDGVEDKLVFTLSTQQIADGVTLSRRLEAEQGANKQATQRLVLHFENTSGQAKKISFTEEIPKWFASNVNQIHFSIPPTKIITADPVVQWENLIGNIGIVSVDVIMEAAIKGYFDPVALRNSLPYWSLEWDRNACKRVQDEETRTQCLLNLADLYAGTLNPKEALHSFCETDFSGKPLERTICYGLLYRDYPDFCEKAGLIKDEGEIDICKGALIEGLCSKKPPAEVDKCYQDIGMLYKSKTACLAVRGSDLQNLCLAKVVPDISLCLKIKDDALRKQCNPEIADLGPLVQMLDYDNWFGQEKNRATYCPRLQAALPGFSIDNVPVSYSSELKCEFRRSNPGWRKDVIVYAYDSEETVRKQLESLIGDHPTDRWLLDEEARLQSEGQGGRVTHLKDGYMIDDPGTNLHRDWVGYKNCTIEIHDLGVNDSASALAANEQLKAMIRQIIDEKIKSGQ